MNEHLLTPCQTNYMTTPPNQTVTCPCCLNVFSNLDAKAEFDRVSAWKLSQAMATIGQRNKGKRKHISTEESERRRQRVAYARQVKAERKAVKS